MALNEANKIREKAMRSEWATLQQQKADMQEQMRLLAAVQGNSKGGAQDPKAVSQLLQGLSKLSAEKEEMQSQRDRSRRK